MLSADDLLAYPLAVAAWSGEAVLVWAVLQQGVADREARDKDGRRPFCWPA